MAFLDLAGGVQTPGPSLGDYAQDRALAAYVIQLVSLFSGIGPRDIGAADRRDAKAAQARQIAMYLTHTGCSWPLARVGIAFGRDRSTASHACHRVEDWRDDPTFDALMETCEECIRTAPRAGNVVLPGVR